MPIIRPDQLGQTTRDDSAAVPRMRTIVFGEARTEPHAAKRASVERAIDAMKREGRLYITPILNEDETLRLFAVEYLTHYIKGQRRDGSNPFQLTTVRLKHRGGEDSDPIKICTERIPLTQSDGTEYTAHPKHVRLYGDWRPGQEIELPLEQAIGTLHRFGWYVSAHLPLRVRRKYRMLVEVVEGEAGPMAVNQEGRLVDIGGQEHSFTPAEQAEAEEEARKNGKLPAHIRKQVGGEAA